LSKVDHRNESVDPLLQNKSHAAKLCYLIVSKHFLKAVKRGHDISLTIFPSNLGTDQACES